MQVRLKSHILKILTVSHGERGADYGVLVALVGLGAVAVVLGPALGHHVGPARVHQTVGHHQAQDGAVVPVKRL